MAPCHTQRSVWVVVSLGLFWGLGFSLHEEGVLSVIAALFVQRNGCYFGLPDVDPWDEARDARLYAGPWPVVAHPPCSRWCLLAALVEATHGYKRGDDGGTFAAALYAVKAFGGVLEHPAFTSAFAHFGIPQPSDRGGWQRCLDGGWVCHVEQWHYGHRARKPTWLYAFGVEVPELKWGPTPEDASPAYVTDGGGDIKRRRPGYVTTPTGKRRERGRGLQGVDQDKLDQVRMRLGGAEASRTPLPFRDLLLSIARTSSLSPTPQPTEGET